MATPGINSSKSIAIDDISFLADACIVQPTQSTLELSKLHSFSSTTRTRLYSSLGTKNLELNFSVLKKLFDSLC